MKKLFKKIKHILGNYSPANKTEQIMYYLNITITF